MHGSWIKCCYEILYKVLFVEVYKAIYSIYDMLRYQWSLLAMCTLKKKRMENVFSTSKKWTSLPVIEVSKPVLVLLLLQNCRCLLSNWARLRDL